jgi:hypothetical protein
LILSEIGGNRFGISLFPLLKLLHSLPLSLLLQRFFFHLLLVQTAFPFLLIGLDFRYQIKLLLRVVIIAQAWSLPTREALRLAVHEHILFEGVRLLML